jgi:hypothetical protein
MDEYFELKGEDGYIKIIVGQVFGFPDKTSHFGGYDTQSEIEIKSQSYFARGTLWTTTGEIYEFYKKLEKHQKELKGTFEFATYERQLEFKIAYNEVGRTKIIGEYREAPGLLTNLTFEISGDQTYLQHSLSELKIIVDKYGNNEGVWK